MEILKTYKLYIGGQFPRTESGRSYLVTAPDGKAFGEGGTITTREDGNKAFSNKVAVQYEQNAVLPVSYDVKNANKFMEGEYKIEVYNNGFKIGEGKTSLKKGGLF